MHTIEFIIYFIAFGILLFCGLVCFCFLVIDTKKEKNLPQLNPNDSEEDLAQKIVRVEIDHEQLERRKKLFEQILEQKRQERLRNGSPPPQ